ncbi:MAG: histidine phosphatase family protein [Myxococcota bacterium]
MGIFLVRHAIAVPRGGDALDHARPLTAKGRSRFERTVDGLDRLGVSLESVYYSPWVRARQTAELLSPIVHGELIETDHLCAPPDAKLLKVLTGDHIALVGHEPWMGSLLALLVVGDAAYGAQFPFKKGGVAHLIGVPTAGGAELVAQYPPKVLRQIAG